MIRSAAAVTSTNLTTPQSAAKPFGQVGMSQIHTLHTSGDQDWVSFAAVAGNHYLIRTATDLTATASVDTVAWLFGTDGHTPIAYNDGGGGFWGSIRSPAPAAGGSSIDDNPAFAVPLTDSSIEWQAEQSGTYYVSVENLAWNPFGDLTNGYNARYQLTIDVIYRIFLPEIQGQ